MKKPKKRTIHTINHSIYIYNHRCFLKHINVVNKHNTSKQSKGIRKGEKERKRERERGKKRK